jgi:hypothetical protein
MLCLRGLDHCMLRNGADAPAYLSVVTRRPLGPIPIHSVPGQS